VDKLTLSLLAKAFRGELVAQDPSDEPASALLARIRSETNGAKKLPRRKAKVVA
jgi:type I restriction enzyme, S subunit